MKAIRITVALVYLMLFAVVLPAPAQHQWSGHAKDEAPPKVAVKKPPHTKKLSKKNRPLTPWNTKGTERKFKDGKPQ